MSASLWEWGVRVQDSGVRIPDSETEVQGASYNRLGRSAWGGPEIAILQAMVDIKVYSGGH